MDIILLYIHHLRGKLSIKTLVLLTIKFGTSKTYTDLHCCTGLPLLCDCLMFTLNSTVTHILSVVLSLTCHVRVSDFSYLYFLQVLDFPLPLSLLNFILLVSDYLSNLLRSFPILIVSPKALASTLNSASSMNFMSMLL